MSSHDLKKTFVETAELELNGSKYTLLERECSCCGKLFHEIWREDRFLLSRYRMKQSVSVDEFNVICEDIEEGSFISTAEIMKNFWENLQEINSENGIDYEDSVKFKYIEHARQKYVILNKRGLAQHLFDDNISEERDKENVRIAFQLGAAAMMQSFMSYGEEHFIEGMRVSEWRERGLPAARIERLRQGRVSRSSIVACAKEAIAQNGLLARNDTSLAKHILARYPDRLKKINGSQLSVSAVCKHLREARRDGAL